jgi:hypothetical protein
MAACFTALFLPKENIFFVSWDFQEKISKKIMVLPETPAHNGGPEFAC